MARRRKQTRAQRAASLRNLKKARAARRMESNPGRKRKRASTATKHAAHRHLARAHKELTAAAKKLGAKGGRVTSSERKRGRLGAKGRRRYRKGRSII